MADQPPVVQRSVKVRGKDLNGKVIVLDKTHPTQLALFQTFLPEEDAEDKYSNTIELYDAIPKYFSNPKIMDAMRENGKYLPTLERVFRHRNEFYRVHIRPARLQDRSGKHKEYYQGCREELVEEALRKIACDQMNGVYLDNQAGVQFTLYALKQELKSRGHDINLPSLVDALRICSGALLSISRDNGKILVESAIFPTLLLASKQDWLESPQTTRCYVQFHSLVTHCMGCITYRQVDYDTHMRYTHRLSRWLHKRLTHNYTQAGLLQPYTIRLSTILRDSGTYQSPRAHNNARHIDEVLTELRNEQILLSIQKEVMRGPRNSLADIKYILLPTLEFIDAVKKANRRTTLLMQKSSFAANAQASS
jgi:hypothetical protein